MAEGIKAFSKHLGLDDVDSPPIWADYIIKQQEEKEKEMESIPEKGASVNA